jgi:hypothetical protein
MPISPALANGSVTVLNPPGATVKDDGVPITPFAPVNETAPVQEGVVGVTAVPAELALLTTVTEAVSVVPSPTAGKT